MWLIGVRHPPFTTPKYLSSFFHRLICIGGALTLSFCQLTGQEGTVIVIQTKGVVEAFSPRGIKLKEPVTRGSVLPVGYAIQTGLFSESVLLFSNGTSATLQEKSKLKLTKFSQAKFDARGTSFGQLNNEPSTSQVSLEMDIGSLVVQTKKLNKSSSFSITSPAGTAGIRGTQFQMATNPNSGMKLDVAESQVAFTPAGQNQPVIVGPGKGLDASPSGMVKQRSINPAVAQNISSKNAAASTACAAVSVATAKQAIEKSSKSSSGDDGSGSENSEDAEAEQENESSDEDSDSSEAADSFINQSANNIREVSGQETSNTYLEKILGLTEEFITSQKISVPDDKPSVQPPNSSVPGFRPPFSPAENFKLSFNQNGELDLIILDFMGNPLGSPITLDALSHEEFKDLLSSWIDDDFYYASLALESFIKNSEQNLYDDANVNENFRGAWFLTSLFFHDLTGIYEISGTFDLEEANWGNIWQGDITPGVVLNAKDLSNYYASEPYLYDLGIALIGEGVLGSTVTDNGIAKDLLDYFIGNSDNPGKGVPNFFTLGEFAESSSEYLLNSVLLGASHNDLLDAEDSVQKQAELSKLFKIYSQNINGVVGQQVHIGSPDKETLINVGKWLHKATNFESDAVKNPSNDKKAFVFAAGKDLHLAGDVTFENSVNGKINKTEDHALGTWKCPGNQYWTCGRKWCSSTGHYGCYRPKL